jgi:tRNA 2-thiouridine synthesizing protein A
MNNDIKTIDARGLSCPQPVMLTRDVIKKMSKGTIEVLIDSATARDNVSRLAKNSGWSVKIEEQPGAVFKIVLNK